MFVEKVKLQEFSYLKAISYTKGEFLFLRQLFHIFN